MSLSSVQPIQLPGGGSVGMAIQLSEGFDAGLDGHVTVLKLAGGGGTFQVDSFFDVFVEISVDDGPLIPSTPDSQLRLANSAIVPTPSGVGMLAVGLCAAMCRRRRRGSC